MDHDIIEQIFGQFSKAKETSFRLHHLLITLKKSTENQLLEKLTASVLHHLPFIKDSGTKVFPHYDTLIFSMQMDCIT